MAEAAIETIGLISGIMGIVDFTEGLVPDKPAEGTVVRIKAGLGSALDDTGGWGGQISAVYGYGWDNEYIGKSDNHVVRKGDDHTFTIDQNSAGMQAGYISVANDNDGTCIAWITVSQHDGSDTGGAWTGDVGKECGQRWYASDQHAGTVTDESGAKVEYIPACTWIDKNFTDGTLSAALKFSVGAYGKNVKSTYDAGSWCDSTIWAEDSNAIAAAPVGKRSLPERPNEMLERLVDAGMLSRGTTAEELCGSETSWGPDYIGSDKKFCDMGTKKISPLCELEEVDGCVDFDETNLFIKKRSTVARRTVKSHHKSYKTYTQYGKKGSSGV